MNSLFLTSYVTISTRPEFSRNKTGFGYMVMDIAKAVGKLEKVEVLATDTRGEDFEYEGVRFLKRSMLQYILAIFSCISLSALIKLRKEYKMANASFIRLVYYWLMTGCLKQIIKKGKYEIVHIHGCGLSTELWMQVCKRCEQKFVVTLHGLNSFSETVRLESAGKQYERDFLKRVTDGEIPITVISTGMKKLIEMTYNTPGCKNITVVCNSFSFDEVENKFGGAKTIREEYNIPQEAKVLLYVGNISKNKNQVQMVRAFGLLPEDLRQRSYVLFCGEDYANDGELENLIASSPECDHLVLCGSVNKEMMPGYYREADGVVLLSYAEGFGLSLIEGMHFGLPCVMPRDLDAFEDIYDDCAVIAIDDRSDSVVAISIEKMLLTKWDAEAIKDYSVKFASTSMAQKYLNEYKAIICS